METIIVTGASGDIGSAVALRLAARGVNLALIGHTNAEALEKTAEEATALGSYCRTYAGNLGSESFVREVFEQIGDEFHRICIKHATPAMLTRHNGRILLISSIWGTRGASFEAAYSATKGGLDSLTKAMAKELAPSGISVNALAPGMVDTKMNSHLSESDLEALREEIPAGRIASPDEVAEMVDLLMQAPGYLTGEIIGFNGGWF